MKRRAVETSDPVQVHVAAAPALVAPAPVAAEAAPAAPAAAAPTSATPAPEPDVPPPSLMTRRRRRYFAGQPPRF